MQLAPCCKKYERLLLFWHLDLDTTISNLNIHWKLERSMDYYAWSSSIFEEQNNFEVPQWPASLYMWQMTKDLQLNMFQLSSIGFLNNLNLAALLELGLLAVLSTFAILTAFFGLVYPQATLIGDGSTGPMSFKRDSLLLTFLYPFCFAVCAAYMSS